MAFVTLEDLSGFAELVVFPVITSYSIHYTKLYELMARTRARALSTPSSCRTSLEVTSP